MTEMAKKLTSAQYFVYFLPLSVGFLLELEKLQETLAYSVARWLDFENVLKVPRKLC